MKKKWLRRLIEGSDEYIRRPPMLMKTQNVHGIVLCLS